MTKVLSIANLFVDTPVTKKYANNGLLELAPLSRINIFIGPTNTGKSRLLREIFSIEKLGWTKGAGNPFKSIAVRAYEDFLKIDSSCKHVKRINEFSIENLKSYISNLEDYIQEPLESLRMLRAVLRPALDISRTSPVVNHKGAPFSLNYGVLSDVNSWGQRYMNDVSKLNVDHDLNKIDRIYIPTRRGTEWMGNQKQDVYKERTFRDYFSGVDFGIERPQKIVTGFSLYETIDELARGDDEKQDSKRRYESFLSESFFEGQEVTLTARKETSLIGVRIGNSKQRFLTELGEGIESVIILTYQLFASAEPCLFFIEEPENGLHPSLQRAFLEACLFNPQHIYFLTSHSNHFLDMSMDLSDVSIFHFDKKVEGGDEHFTVRNVSSPEKELLNGLGVRSSSVFLSNATIWVEGITDRKYLKAYMKKYISSGKLGNGEKEEKWSKYKEDLHYSFVEYQGSNLGHWHFEVQDSNFDEMKVISMCSHPVLIADGDVAKNVEVCERLTETLGDRFVTLNCKEIENLIPLEVLKGVIGNEFVAYGGDLKKLNYTQYSTLDTGIGGYLDEKLPDEGTYTDKNQNKRKRFSDSGKGTWKSKHPRCNKAIEFMEDEENQWDLTEPIIELVEKIFEHIEECNS